MINLDDKNISYMVISSQKIGDVSSYLYAKNYHLTEIKSFFEGYFQDCILAFSSVGNDEVRKDAIHILEIFNEGSLNIKYFGDTSAKKIFQNGSEKPLSIINYSTDSSLPSYILGAQSFSFVESKSYRLISAKGELKSGMIVEYLNNNKWVPKKVENPNEEYEKFYKLLIKYEKVRTKG